MTKIFFTADTHFSFGRVRELSKRPYKSVQEMDEAMLSNWNNLVQDNDTIYHLGDFGDPQRVHELQGNIIFCPEITTMKRLSPH